LSTGGIVRDWSFLQLLCLGGFASGYSLQPYGMQLFHRAGLIGRSDESTGRLFTHPRLTRMVQCC